MNNTYICRCKKFQNIKMMDFKQSHQTVINYLPISEDDIQWGMYIKGIGYQSISSNESYPAKGHPIGYTFNPQIGRTIDSFALVYITKGQGIFVSSTQREKTLEQGAAFVIFPHEWHSYRPFEKVGWNEYWVTFGGTYFEKFVSELIDKSNPFFSIGVNDQIVKLFREMLTCASEQKIGFQKVLTGATMHMLGLMHSISNNNVFNNRDIELIQQACVIMRENVYSKQKPEEIADLLNVSYSSFRKFFKQYTGLAPYQYVLQLKIEKAKELLAGSDVPIHEIAIKLHFESTDYFSYFFKKEAGVSPLAYRKDIETQRISDIRSFMEANM